MIDLMLWSSDLATIRSFATARGLIQNGETAPGVEYCLWGGDGAVTRAPRQMRTEAALSLSVLGEAAIVLPGGTAPLWLEDGVTIENDGEIVGTYDRVQAGRAVFKTPGVTLAVGLTVEVWSPLVTLTGVAVLLRLHSQALVDDALVPDDADPDKAEQWARSKVARWVKNNGTLGTIEEIPYYLVDGVRLFRPADAIPLIQSWGGAGHEWAGGNAF